MTLTLVSHPLPVAWDGRAVAWDRWESPLVPMFIFPTPKRERCECGSDAAPFTARGRREPSAERVANAASLPRIGRPTPLVWSVYDLRAYRCPSCGIVSVWDMDSDELWTLDESDYGSTGSWAWSGGLLDALLTDQPNGDEGENQ